MPRHPADGVYSREQMLRDYPALPGVLRTLGFIRPPTVEFVYSPNFVTEEDFKPIRGLRSDDTVVPDDFGSTEEW